MFYLTSFNKFIRTEFCYGNGLTLSNSDTVSYVSIHENNDCICDIIDKTIT